MKVDRADRHAGTLDRSRTTEGARIELLFFRDREAFEAGRSSGTRHLRRPLDASLLERLRALGREPL